MSERILDIHNAGNPDVGRLIKVEKIVIFSTAILFSLKSPLNAFEVTASSRIFTSSSVIG